MVLNQNGIFSRASKSAIITEIAKVEETAKMIYSEKIMDNAENNRGSQVETSEVIAELQNLGHHIEKRPVAEGDITGISLDKTSLTIGTNKLAEIKVIYEGAEDPFVYYLEVQDNYYQMHSKKGDITIDKIESGLTSSDFEATGGESAISNALTITTNPTNIITAVLKTGSTNTIEISSSETEGDTTVTVKYGKLAPKICTVKVIEPILATGITLNKTKDVVTGGLSWTNDSQLIATLEPSNVTEKEVKWESSNPNIATIDSNGLVKAGTIGGDVTITATTKDGTNLSAECTITTEIFGAINNVDNIDYKDKENNQAKIPKGFAVGTSDNVSIISKGLVIQDITGNQWVWVPCYLDDNGTKLGQQQYSQATEYKRTDFGKGVTLTECSESLDTTDSESIKKYGGFYIGRYEAGRVGTDTVVIKRNQIPYNNIAITDCKTKSTNFAGANSYETDKVYTKLVSSYAWDTALNFIDKTVSNYSTNSPQGNYSNTNFISGKQLMNTGVTTSVCNIYDMGGNISEYTSELNPQRQCLRK